MLIACIIDSEDNESYEGMRIMKIELQRTIREEIEFSGIGIHTGATARVRILPSGADTGIRFVRKDVAGSRPIKASTANVTSTNHATTIGLNGSSVSTVEHLLAVFYGMGIDNALVEVYGTEIPVMDGSASHFIGLLDEAGVKELGTQKKFLVVKKPVRVADDDKFIEFLPSRTPGLFIDFSIDFTHPLLERQSFSMSLNTETFKKELAHARTFAFLKDVELMRENGLARGGSLDNAVVIGESEILNQDGLRYHDEFVRHKVLDLIGDIALLGTTIIGRITAHRSGHSLNHRLAKKLLSSPDSWELVEYAELDEPTSNDAVNLPYEGISRGVATA